MQPQTLSMMFLESREAVRRFIIPIPPSYLPKGMAVATRDLTVGIECDTMKLLPNFNILDLLHWVMQSSRELSLKPWE